MAKEFKFVMVEKVLAEKLKKVAGNLECSINGLLESMDKDEVFENWVDDELERQKNKSR